jgi:hypothetical protein
MLAEGTAEILKKIGVDYVVRARRELGVKRRVRSKSTGKTYRKRVNTTGKLRRSFRVVMQEDNNMEVTAADYANDVNEGTPRRASASRLATWIKQKPVRLRDSNGRFVPMTAARVANFAKYLAWKIRRIGSDRTGYLDGLAEKSIEKYENQLVDGIEDDYVEYFEEVIIVLPNLEVIKVD